MASPPVNTQNSTSHSKYIYKGSRAWESLLLRAIFFVSYIPCSGKCDSRGSLQLAHNRIQESIKKRCPSERKTMGNVLKNYGQRRKKRWATFSKMTGNVFEKHRQRFPKRRATLFTVSCLADYQDIRRQLQSEVYLHFAYIQLSMESMGGKTKKDDCMSKHKCHSAQTKTNK